MGTKDYTQWTRKEFESLPSPDSYQNNIGDVDSLIVLPTRRTHDSGYRCMRFVTIQNGIPTYVISGCSDVIHLGGIGGLNVKPFNSSTHRYRLASQKTPSIDWSIDCLPKSGLLRIFCGKKLIVGASLSSFELFFKED